MGEIFTLSIQEVFVYSFFMTIHLQIALTLANKVFERSDFLETNTTIEPFLRQRLEVGCSLLLLFIPYIQLILHKCMKYRVSDDDDLWYIPLNN